MMITIVCKPCCGTGSIESSDSTDDRWWKCTLCDGTGERTITDRRKAPGLREEYLIIHAPGWPGGINPVPQTLARAEEFVREHGGQLMIRQLTDWQEREVMTEAKA